MRPKSDFYFTLSQARRLRGLQRAGRRLHERRAGFFRFRPQQGENAAGPISKTFRARAAFCLIVLPGVSTVPLAFLIILAGSSRAVAIKPNRRLELSSIQARSDLNLPMAKARGF